MCTPKKFIAFAVIAVALLAPVAAAQQLAPQLVKFQATDRIATGKVAVYDLKEESTAFSYRIQGEYILARVQKQRDGEWADIGRVRGAPPRPLDFWPVFRKIGLGSFRIVARAHVGTGEERRSSSARTIRFEVVRHIDHRD